MRKPGTLLVSSLLLLALTGGLAILAALSWHPPRPVSAPYGSVVFLGYTNDSSGAQLATFAITNASDVPVARAPHCVIAFALQGGWRVSAAVPLSSPARERVLGAGASEIVTVPVPSQRATWRISIYLSNDVGPTWPIKRLVNAALPLMGRSSPYGYTTCQVDSGRIEPLLTIPQ